MLPPTLTVLDWSVIVCYLLLSLGIGLWASRQGKRNTEDFFLGGRGLPWGLAGLSLVATTFAADTPLAVTELVRQRGISANWLWWNMLVGGMVTTFFFARLWRRSGVLTDVELVTIRYSGPAVHWLRGFKALYQGLFLNALIIGWVNLAMVAIFEVFFGLSRSEALLYTGLTMLLTTGYAALSGLRGVVLTDAVQFVIAMSGCIVLAVLVLADVRVGGLAGLTRQLPEYTLRFFPSVGEVKAGPGQLTLGLGSFVAFVGMQWWASWYPGAEPGGGGYVAQRMLAAKNERHALGAVLLFNVLHYAVRPWPWILVALATLLIYPQLPIDDAKLAYVFAIRDFMPSGLRGLLLVAFLAAYMSTLSTQLNWGSSYLINDMFRPYLRPNATERQLVGAARWATLLLMLLSLAITTQIESIADAWRFLIECGAGTGLVLILRWYWWRLSAWSELAATVIPFVSYTACQLMFHLADHAHLSSWWQFPNTFFVTVGVTLVGTALVTALTPPTDAATLRAFAARVRPQGWWGPYAVDTTGQAPLGVLALCTLAGTALVLGVLFGLGALLLQRPLEGALWLALAAGATAALVLLGRRYAVFT